MRLDGCSSARACGFVPSARAVPERPRDNRRRPRRRSATFDLPSRDQLSANMATRMNDDMRRRFEQVDQLTDPNDRFRALGSLTMELYSFDLVTTDQEIDDSEPGSNHETWEDMVRLQTEGVYPAAFAAIKSPVLMLHGADDPHPGQMIRASLEPHIPQLEYREWQRCGHYPWLEKSTRDEFFSVLRKWLQKSCKVRLAI